MRARDRAVLLETDATLSDMVGLQRHNVSFVIVMALLVLACSTEPPSHFGEQFDGNSAQLLAAVIHEQDSGESVTVVVSGQIRQVCRSAGCWLVLEDGHGPSYVELLVDFKPAANFTVPITIEKRRALVFGDLSGVGPDRVLNARGLILE